MVAAISRAWSRTSVRVLDAAVSRAVGRRIVRRAPFWHSRLTARAHTMSSVTADEETAFVAACTTLVTLQDGTRIRVRPIMPSDREQIEAGFEHLSEASRRSRFFTLLPRLPESWLNSLTDLDYRNHVALGAAAIDNPGEPGVAIARYIRCADEPNCAEAAVTVLDDYQRRGIATVLLEALALIALENGITRFCAYVQWGNPEVVKLARTLGASVRHDSVGVARVQRCSRGRRRPHRGNGARGRSALACPPRGVARPPRCRSARSRGFATGLTSCHVHLCPRDDPTPNAATCSGAYVSVARQGGLDRRRIDATAG